MKLRNFKTRDVIKILEANNFKAKRQSGTHLIMRNTGKITVVPLHHKEIPIGTLKSIEKQSGVNLREKFG